MSKHTVKKGNRVLEVSEDVLNSYLVRGYDEVNKKGEVIKVATGGKSVSIHDYNKAIEELNELKKVVSNVSNVSLETRIKELEEENAELLNDVKMLEQALEEEKKSKKK